MRRPRSPAEIARPTLAELPEHAATGETAAIYAALRHALGVPMVNLVFRHMATVPACLSWAWRCLAPVYANETIHSAGAAMAAVIDGSATPLERDLDGMPLAGIVDTLDAYIRANPINCIGLGLLVRALNGQADPAALPDRGRPATVTPIPTILPMADLAQLPESTLADLRRAATAIHREESPVIPSILRHFAPWPELLRMIGDRLAAMDRSGDLDRFDHAMTVIADNAAASLALSAVPAPDALTARTVQILARQFRPNMTRVTVVAAALRGALVSSSLANRPPLSDALRGGKPWFI